LTGEEYETATEIVKRLLGKDREGMNPGETRRMIVLAETVAGEYRAENYLPFLKAAKELNTIYERLMKGDDGVHREVGSDDR
jgi:hypothetical protein